MVSLSAAVWGKGKAVVKRVAMVSLSAVVIRLYRIDHYCGWGFEYRSSNNEPIHVYSNLLEYDELGTVGRHICAVVIFNIILLYAARRAMTAAALLPIVCVCVIFYWLSRCRSNGGGFYMTFSRATNQPCR